MNTPYFRRLLLVLVIYSNLGRHCVIINSSSFQLTRYKNKVLENEQCFQNITEEMVTNCFQRCLENCLCTSFQICASTCQLCAGDVERQRGILHDKKGCTYFNFTADNESKTYEQQCRKGCATGTNCCLTSQPCFNGGTCFPSADKSRFICRCTKYFRGKRCRRCAEGYGGRLCQAPIKSCRGYENGSRVAKIYRIFDNSMNLYPVMCDFDRHSLRTWTLVQSFEFEKHDSFKSSFVLSKTVHEKSPGYEEYRISREKMLEIAQDSTHWRITCDHKKGKEISYTDYVEATLENADILTFNGNRCVEVEYISIRGHNCSKCTAYMLQSHNRKVNAYYMGLHFDSRLGASFSCEHNATVGSRICNKMGEDNFGFFDCSNPKHRCSANNKSITSTWLGG